MIKEDVITRICQKTKYNRYIVTSVVDSMLDSITEGLASGERVQFVGFGTFEPKRCAPRTGRNPHTNEPVPIPARIVPYFKAGKLLKDAVVKTCDEN